jgi:hypothetical protein
MKAGDSFLLALRPAAYRIGYKGAYFWKIINERQCNEIETISCEKLRSSFKKLKEGTPAPCSHFS